MLTFHTGPYSETSYQGERFYLYPTHRQGKSPSFHFGLPVAKLAILGERMSGVEELGKPFLGPTSV
jgi:hypothetical protein